MNPEKGADCQFYIKNRANEHDLVGQLLMGPSAQRHTPKVKIDPNLIILLKELSKMQMLAIYLEMIHMNKKEKEAQSDMRASIISKNNEQKLIN